MHTKSTYLYVRTTVSLSNDWDDSIRFFIKHFPEWQVTKFFELDGTACTPFKPLDLFGFDCRMWANGFAIRFDPLLPLPEFVDLARPALEKFDAWCMANERREYFEAPIDATFASFFSRSKGPSTAQIFVRNKRVDVVDQLLAQLREELYPYSSTVFHFEDGRIIFIDFAQPARIIEQGYQHVFRNIGDYIIVDSSGHCPNRQAYAEIKLSDLAHALRYNRRSEAGVPSL